MKLLIAALALGAPLATAPASAAVAPATAPASDLDGLVLLLVPEQQMLDMMMVAAQKGLDENNAADFAAYPGMRDYVMAQLRPDLTRVLRAAVPELRTRIAAILKRELTPGEISDLYTFFASPAGRKVYAIMIETAGQNAGQSDEAIKQAMLDKIMASLTPEDYGPMAAFGTSGGAAKMQTLSPMIRDATERWTSKLLAENSAPMQARRDAAIAEFKRKHPVAGQ